MQNKDVAKSFVKGVFATGSNFYTDGEKIFSYNTIVAQRTNGGYIVNTTKYSCTTSKHQTYLRRALEGFQVKETEKPVPYGATDLAKYVAKTEKGAA